jgi:alpha-1,3-rhamnosyl/mannosyltransferase
MTRIVVDATSLLLRSAGVKNYTWHWLNAMRNIAGAERIGAFPFIKHCGTLRHDGSVFPALATWPRLGVLYAVNLFGSGALDACIGPASVFHASNQVHFAPRRALLTATIHDATCWKMPELHTSGNVLADRRFADRILRRADGLIAVSEATRQDAIEEIGIAEDRIETIHSGVSDAFFHVGANSVLELKERLGLHKPYVLFVGAIEPRKNIDRLLNAWLALKPSLRWEFDLVVAGAGGWASTTLARLGSQMESVRYLGYAAEEDLAALTAGALVFIYPSLYEGFGFPVVQAMAAGVPVITSNISALPEITGGAAHLIDPLSHTEITAALTRLLESGTLRERLGLRGNERAQNFRWSRCAKRSLAFFDRLANR